VEDKALFKWVEAQEAEAKSFGFYWESLDQLIDQIQSECAEIKEAYQNNNRPHLQEEVGDLLNAAASLAIFCGVDPHNTLHQSCEKFQKRYDAVVSLVKKDGLSDLQNQPFDRLMHYWKLAKNAS